MATDRPSGVGHKPIDEAKAKVPVSDLTERLSGPGVRRGREVLFCCPLHEDANPSLRVDPEKNVWFCFPCGVGGDVVKLAQLAWGHDRADVAAAELLMAFGFEVPQRPPSWFRKQERQRPIRDEINRVRFEHLRRRLYRAFFARSVEAIEDPDERRTEAQAMWEATNPLARLLLERRSS